MRLTILVNCCVLLASVCAASDAAKTTSDATPVLKERLREVPPPMPDFRRPKPIDPTEVVIRVYDAKGNVEQRTIRFGRLPRDFALDTQRSKVQERPRFTEGTLEPWPTPYSMTRDDVTLLAPIEAAPLLQASGPCR